MMQSDPLPPATVLIVESDAITRERLESLLQAGGLGVVSIPKPILPGWIVAEILRARRSGA